MKSPQEEVGERSEYQVDDREILLGFYQRVLFRPVLARIPDSVAPNAISLLGLLCSLSAVSIILASRRWGVPAGYLVGSVLFFGYLTADNVDGALARRSGQTSRMGELLDHGLDGLSSASMLIAGGVLLGMGPPWFFALAGLGAVTFVVTIWEQHVTGTLVIPAVSGTEAVTIMAGLCLVAFLGNDPTWLVLNPSSLNLSMGVLIVVLLGYSAALVPPCLRLARGGHGLHKLAGPVANIVLCGLWVWAGSGPVLPAVIASVYAARLAVRLIVHRHIGSPARLTVPSDWLATVPLLVAVTLPAVWTARGWASVAALIAVAAYLHTFRWGAQVLRGLPEASPLAASAALEPAPEGTC